MNIFYNPNISQRELADLLIVSEANVGQIVKRLEKNNSVYREYYEDNKSRRIIHLTRKGNDAVSLLLKIAREWESKFFENYSLDDKKRFKEMISDYYQKSSIE